jgi:hypothetical protein
MRPPTVDKNAVALSRWITLLLAIRPALNQLRGDTSLFDLGAFHVSVLALWTLAFLVIAAARFAHTPPIPSSVRRPIVGFLFVVFLLGVPRILDASALITDVIVFIEFFLTLLIAGAVIDDLGLEYIVKRIAIGTAVLLVMHATASLWSSPPDIYSVANGDMQEAQQIGAYLGAFESKHLAAHSFFFVLPFLICGAIRLRKRYLFLLIPPTAIAMVLTLERTSIVSLALFAITYVVVARSIRFVVPLVLVGVVAIAAIPSESMQKFMEAKVQDEVDAMREGDVGELGANRVAIAFLAQDRFFNESSVFEQFFGHGTAQAYTLHLLIVGKLAYAHIEAIELLIDYGIVGLLLAFAILAAVGASKMREIRRERTPERLVGIAMLVVVFAQMFFAMPLQDGGTTALLAFWLFPSLTQVQEV